jgi:peptidoglycan/LPS O-acetylase OafA/YrhL
MQSALATLGSRLGHGVLWLTTLRKQRLIIGVLLLLLARPTYITYDFRGTWIMAILCVAGGVVGILMGLLYPHADETDERDTFLGIIVALTFLVRFVVFVAEDLRSIDDLWSWAALGELYDGGSAPIIHLMLTYVGLVLAARPFRSGERNGHAV